MLETGCLSKPNHHLHQANKINWSERNKKERRGKLQPPIGGCSPSPPTAPPHPSRRRHRRNRPTLPRRRRIQPPASSSPQVPALLRPSNPALLVRWLLACPLVALAALLDLFSGSAPPRRRANLGWGGFARCGSPDCAAALGVGGGRVLDWFFWGLKRLDKNFASRSW